jgi:hypothetical protein
MPETVARWIKDCEELLQYISRISAGTEERIAPEWLTRRMHLAGKGQAIYAS